MTDIARVRSATGDMLSSLADLELSPMMLRQSRDRAKVATLRLGDHSPTFVFELML
jgi:hypothetical protein